VGVDSSFAFDATLDLVPIVDQVAWRLIPRERFRDLACNPFRGLVCCDVDQDRVSACQPDDDQGIEKVEANRWHKRTRQLRWISTVNQRGTLTPAASKSFAQTAGVTVGRRRNPLKSPILALLQRLYRS
jgi:hypothetical protein